MKRRGFLAALMGFFVLPSAATYGRTWKATETGLTVPEQSVLPTGFDMAAYTVAYFEIDPVYRQQRASLIQFPDGRLLEVPAGAIVRAFAREPVIDL